MNGPSIHAVAFPHRGHWVAQCLEYDIATQAETLDELLGEIQYLLAAHVLVAERENLEPFAELSKAPKRFWEMYERAHPSPRRQDDNPRRPTRITFSTHPLMSS
jgi:hypothetical protein